MSCDKRCSRKCTYYGYENCVLTNNKLFETGSSRRSLTSAILQKRIVSSSSTALEEKPVYFEISKHRATSITTRGKMTTDMCVRSGGKAYKVACT